MPFFECCLHCGTKEELSEQVLKGLSTHHDGFVYQPCFACGVENAKHVRYWVFPVTKTFKERDNADNNSL